jgi:omega-6 fatty acid desaturase (delta-12 desaturase)
MRHSTVARHVAPLGWGRRMALYLVKRNQRRKRDYRFRRQVRGPFWIRLPLFQKMTDTADLRRKLRPLRAKSSALALVIFAADASLYAAATWFAFTSRTTLPAIASGLIAMLAIGMLFVVGHDACHGSFTSSPRLNGWIGRAAFLPSLTPFAAWDEGHNRTHHVYTNLKNRDYVWTPFSKAEFDALPRWRRGLERIYRTPPGVALYYAREIWWNHLFFTRDTNAAADSLLCTAYAIGLTAMALAIGWRPWLAGVVLPFAGWNWMMGWAIFEHHTHPRVPWFAEERQWRAAGAQTLCTIHIVLPEPLDFILHRIMQHTAHHLDVTVPLYRLKQAQGTVESAAATVTYRWSPLTFLRHLRVCKLYDFENHQWLGFDGKPSGQPARENCELAASPPGIPQGEAGHPIPIPSRADG